MHPKNQRPQSSSYGADYAADENTAIPAADRGKVVYSGPREKRRGSGL